jgi:predicted Ser/Thr protein kinase
MFYLWAFFRPHYAVMFKDINGITEENLLEWIRKSTKDGSNVLSRGYQGEVYLYKDDANSLIIKTPREGFFEELIGKAMLRREYRIYCKLTGMKGVPRCYGFIKGKYLILEYINGITVRKATIANRRVFFEGLLNLIKELHGAGIAHMDLKKKDNLIVVDGTTPYIIDFGAAISKKSGFSPLNWYLYSLASKFDFNAWIKLKYGKRFEDIIDEDRQYSRVTFIEKGSMLLKRSYRRIRKFLYKIL